MHVLLVFNKEDPQIITLKNAIIKCGFKINCCKNIEEIHEAFKKNNYDLVFIDCRRQSSTSSSSSASSIKSNATGSNIVTGATNQATNTSGKNQYDYENICRFIRKLFQYTIIVALTHSYDDREVPNILPLLKTGFNRIFSETTNLNRCINELLTLEYGEVSTVRRLQAAHVLFTALEYSNDPIEILNDQFKILYVNNAFEKLTGYTLNELSGLDFNHIHQVDSNEINKNISQGNAWENELSFSKSNGEVSNHLSITIPVIVQGELNKIQNYVTITNLSDKALIQSRSSHPSGSSSVSTSVATSAVSIKKIPSFSLSKKSFDFERFATLTLQPSVTSQTTTALQSQSIANNAQLSSQTPTIDENENDAPAASPTTGPTRHHNHHPPSPTTLFNLSPSLSDSTVAGRISFAADDKSYNDETNLNEAKSLSSPFEHAPYPKSHLQRKLSYDLQSTTYNNSDFPRRHSTARNVSTQSSMEAPIRKLINFICTAHEKSNTDAVKRNLEKALDILRSTELYNPSLKNNDKHTSDLVSGLMSNGFQKLAGTANILGNKQLLSQVSVAFSQSYVKNLPAEITSILDTEELWSFDIIALERLTNKRPLVTLGLKTMTRFNVCEYLKIDQTILVNWLSLIESNYKQSNPYHNSTHASDVLHATAYFLSTNKLSQILDEIDRVASLIAAAIHDLNHPGRTNAFLCNSNNELAILYNDQAVLENHHAALAFQLTRGNDDTNIFKNLSRDEYRALRLVVIDMVLATEMNKHFEHLNKFVNKFGVDGEKETSLNEANKIQENKVLIKRILIKCADVSNPCRPLDIYKEWVNRIAAEYFEQTDEEKAKNLPVVMPIFDRSNCNVPKAQISFIEYFITDMFEAWDDFIDIPEVTSNLQANTVYWRECAEALQLQQLQQLQQKHNSQQTGQQTDGKGEIRNNSILEDSENELENES